MSGYLKKNTELSTIAATDTTDATVKTEITGNANTALLYRHRLSLTLLAFLAGLGINITRFAFFSQTESTYEKMINTASESAPILINVIFAIALLVLLIAIFVAPLRMLVSVFIVFTVLSLMAVLEGLGVPFFLSIPVAILVYIGLNRLEMTWQEPAEIKMTVTEPPAGKSTNDI